MSTPLKCPYYRLNSTSKGGGDFNTIPEGKNYGDYLFWDGAQWMVGSNTVHLGANAGRPVQGNYAISVGQEAGTNGQKSYAIAIGYSAGAQLQNMNAIAIGQQAGYNYQGTEAVAIGNQSGYNLQSQNAIAIGTQAGYNQQGENAIALGKYSGNDVQGRNAIAIGQNAGVFTQGENAIAIGQNVGIFNQGYNCIAIGQNAGQTAQQPESIILNVGETGVEASNFGLFVNPIRGPFATANVLSYNLTTKEIVYNGSSQRYKYDIQPLNENTENLYKLEPKQFRYNQNGEMDIGLIAEEANECDPWFSYRDQDGNPEGILWNSITTYMIAEMKKIKDEIAVFELEIQRLKETNIQ
jgi:hypothetical protein